MHDLAEAAAQLETDSQSKQQTHVPMDLPETAGYRREMELKEEEMRRMKEESRLRDEEMTRIQEELTRTKEEMNRTKEESARKEIESLRNQLKDSRRCYEDSSVMGKLNAHIAYAALHKDLNLKVSFPQRLQSGVTEL